MALSTEFATPNQKFDPTRYSRKSAFRAAKVNKTASRPEVLAENLKVIPSPQELLMPETTNTLASPTVSETKDLKNTTFVTESTFEIKTRRTIPATNVTITEQLESAAILEAEAERTTPIFCCAPEPDCSKYRVKEAQNATSLEAKIEQQASISGSEGELIKTGSENIQPCHANLLTAKNLDLASIPAPEYVESTATRRLVSLRRIRNIRQAKVESRWLTLARVDEWTCTIPRHAFKEGELVVYIEIDAFLPSADRRFGTMSSLQTFNGDLGHRVKTRRFGSYPDKLVVQGYIYPLEKFDEIFQEIERIRQVLDNMSNEKPSQEMIKDVICAMYINEDWANKIGVKWEESNPANGNPIKHPKLGAIPTRVFRKTDITHFEDCPNLFTKRKYFTNEYQESIKMDGASMTVYFVKKTAKKYNDLNELPGEVGLNMVLNNGRLGVTSKATDMNELSPCAFGYWKTALKNSLPAKLSKLNRSIAVQGEICGPGINQNRENLEEIDFFVYSMWDIAAQKYITPRKVETLAEKLGLKHVPVLRYVKIREIASKHSELRDLADKRPGEGLVYKCVRDGRSFKVHSPSYKILHNC